MKILLVEDDLIIAEKIQLVLQNEGYLVEHVNSGKDAWYVGETEDFSAAILDLGLPDMDGLSVLKNWRASGLKIPVLILTARGSWEERVTGIDAGADDYLPKPFQMAEMLARLRAIIRRSVGQATAILQAGGLRLDTLTKTVSLDGVAQQLTPMEYRCMHYLMLNRGKAISQMVLTEQLYAQGFERDSNSVEVLVGRLRKKLGKDTIMTKRGFGYLVSN